MSSRIRVWFLFLIILAPAILAIPIPISWKPFHYLEQSLKVDLTNGKAKQEALFPIPIQSDVFGKSLFSSLLGIETGSMQTYVCISNTSNVIYPNNEIVDPNVFINEGGRADIFVKLNQDDANSLIRIPLATSSCYFILAKNKSGLGNEITWQVQGTEKLVNVKFLMNAKMGFKFEWPIFFKNYFILLAGWILLLSSLIQVLQFLKRNNSSEIYFMNDINRKILSYLTEKDKASEVVVINETFNDFGISKEEYTKRLKELQTKDFIRYERPFGNDAFIYATESGRSAVKPLSRRIKEYVSSHFLEILILLTALLTLWITYYIR